MSEQEILHVKDINQQIKYEFTLNLMNKDLALIIKRTLEVDPEFSISILREFNITNEGNLKVSYESKAIYLKMMKKSINGMFENMTLVLKTVSRYSPMIKRE
jgi:hypothetical protein